LVDAGFALGPSHRLRPKGETAGMARKVFLVVLAPLVAEYLLGNVSTRLLLACRS
jgi:hypothetical protein